MTSFYKRALLLVLMVVAAALAILLRPTHKLADEGPALDLDKAIPAAFGTWKEIQEPATQVIDPRQQETISRIYSKTLSRTYVSSNGDRIMLSIAYGEDQRDAKQTHYPEVCYPAQGFQVISNTESELAGPNFHLPIRRIETQLNSQRPEPVTYWTVVGTTPTLGGVSKKYAELKYALRGQIPDGLLFRVSSVDPDSRHAFATQDAFIRDISTAIAPQYRPRLMGAHD